MTQILRWGMGMAMVLGTAASGCASTADADTNTSWSMGEEPAPSADSSLTQAWSVNLSAEGTQAGVPSLRWIDDRFVVAWVTSSSQGSFPHVIRADVAPDGGEATITEAETETYLAASVTLGPDRNVVVSVGSGFNSQCVLETYDANVAKIATTQFPCKSRASVVPIGPGQWLTSYGEEIVDHPENAQNVVVGPFEPEATEPIAGKVSVGSSDESADPAMYLEDGEAAVVWNTADQGAEIRRLHDVTGVGLSSVSAPFVTGVATEGSHGFGSLDGRALVFGQNGSTLWTADVTAANGPVASKVVAPSGIKDRGVGVAAARELGLFGVCYATGPGPGGGFGAGDGVSFVVLNAEGDVVAGPVVIEDGFPNIGGCQVAWSGEDFAVAYWRIQLPGSRVQLAKVQVSL